MLDSEHRLSESLGVSRGTVRAAIAELVVTGELTRRPHARPTIGASKERSARTDGRDVYVWVSHPISDHATLMFLKGVSLGFNGTPYRVIVREPTRFFGDHVRWDERQFLAGLLENEGVAGAIIQRDPCAQNADMFRRLAEAGIPLAFVDSPPPEGVEADFVGTANLSSARRCVEHLVELGHQRIVCLVESDESPVTQQRIQGYWRAMRVAGLEAQGACLVASEREAVLNPLPRAGRFASRVNTYGAYAQWSQTLASAILEMPELPTALFVSCDVLAQSVGALLEGAGLRIPDDVSLVGFDWLARWETGQVDDLTTASQDFEGFGRQAADLVLDRLTDGVAGPSRHVLFPASLIVRSSTAPRATQPSSPGSLGDAALMKS